MVNTFFCDSDVFLNLLHGSVPLFQLPVTYLYSKIVIGDFTLFEVSCHGKKSIGKTLAPWLNKNPNLIIASAASDDFKEKMNSFFQKEVPSVQDEADFLLALKNEVFGYLASEFESTLLTLMLICSESTALSYLEASAFKISKDSDTAKSIKQKADELSLDLDHRIFQKIYSDIRTIDQKNNFDRSTIHSLFNFYYYNIMGITFKFHNEVAAQFKAKKKISVKEVRGLFNELKENIKKFLFVSSLLLKKEIVPDAAVKNMNYVSALTKAAQKDANWEKSQTIKLIDQFLELRVSINKEYDFLTIFDRNLCHSLLTGILPSSNTFFDVYNLTCFANQKIPNGVYLSLDGPQYNSYISPSQDSSLLLSKPFYPHQ